MNEAAGAVSVILWRHPFPSRLGLEVDHPLLVDGGLVVRDLVPLHGLGRETAGVVESHPGP